MARKSLETKYQLLKVKLWIVNKLIFGGLAVALRKSYIHLPFFIVKAISSFSPCYGNHFIRRDEYVLQWNNRIPHETAFFKYIMQGK